MTGKADFSEEEWREVLEGPPSAALLVIAAEHGGTFKETIAIGRAYADARVHHGQSELLDAVVAAKPVVDHTRYHSPEEVRERSLGHVRDAVALVAAHADPQELGEFKGFIVHLAEAVAQAHKEAGGAPVGEHEREAIDALKQAVG
jgi:hypothetical protein